MDENRTDKVTKKWQELLRKFEKGHFGKPADFWLGFNITFLF